MSKKKKVWCISVPLIDTPCELCGVECDPLTKQPIGPCSIQRCPHCGFYSCGSADPKFDQWEVYESTPATPEQVVELFATDNCNGLTLEQTRMRCQVALCPGCGSVLPGGYQIKYLCRAFVKDPSRFTIT